MDNEIRVSVCVVTYNQEKYIAECLQSLVEQKTDFRFEIIVGEDCSTDKTRGVVETFASKYPGLIVSNYHESNVGAVANIVSSYKLAKGKYICHMDGDDYALPGKIQKQFEVLENNPECVICSHDVKQVDQEGRLIRASFREKKEGRYGLMQLYADLPFFAHSSKMFLNDLGESYWDRLHKDALDIEVHVEQAKRGSIFHIDEVLGAYRLGVGVSSLCGKVNPSLVNGVDRIFNSALNNELFEVGLIKRFYAKSLFSQAYQSALFDNREDLLFFIDRSSFMCKLDIKQRAFYELSRFPVLLVALCRLRAKIRGF
tara:strand:- start:5453 stop:6394 length:942 start_codon:yes stop_codon:yes gene_type:complete